MEQKNKIDGINANPKEPLKKEPSEAPAGGGTPPAGGVPPPKKTSEQNKFMKFLKERKILIIIFAAIIILLIIIFADRSLVEKVIPETIRRLGKGGGELPLSGNMIEFGDTSPISGIKCKNSDKRPVAVMVASDQITRPLSGLSEADLVIEMPVLVNDVTRLMAVYVCGEPKEIGSIRSARHDYIWLALGFDAIFAHWGGSYHALNFLRLDPNVNAITDNIDALQNPYNAYWRKSNLPAPYNGFTSMSRLREAAKKLGYREESRFEGYPHGDEVPLENRPNGGRLVIGYPGSMRVEYEYDKNTNSYLRIWGGIPDTDFNNGKRITAKNIVVMRADQRLKKPGEAYNEVDVEGEGVAEIYQNGGVIKGTWKKDIIHKQSKLYFYDQDGAEIKFVPGQIWIEVIEPYKDVVWTPGT